MIADFNFSFAKNHKNKIPDRNGEDHLEDLGCEGKGILAILSAK